MHVKLKTSDFYEFFVSLIRFINAIKPENAKATRLEILCLYQFAALPEKFHYGRFLSRARSKVLENSKTSVYPFSQRSLRTLIASLKRKGFLVTDEDGFLDFSPMISSAVKQFTTDSQFSLTVTFSA